MSLTSEFERELAIVEARLRLVAWRDKQMVAVTEQFEAAWPALAENIDRHVAELSLWRVAQSHTSVASALEELLAPWRQEQWRIASVRADESLTAVMATLPQDSLASHAGTILPAVAGVGLVAASVAAIPAVMSFATVSATSLLFFSTSTISIPLLLVGGGAVAALSLTGSTVLGSAMQTGRNNLAERMKTHARSAIFGDGRPLTERSILSDTQAAVLKSAQTALEA